jgi:hypothetical protein
LNPHPGSNPREVFGFKVAGHGKVKVGGQEFVFHLLIHRIDQLGAEHLHLSLTGSQFTDSPTGCWVVIEAGVIAQVAENYT